MLYFDLTKAVQQKHQSGLRRVSLCLRRGLAHEPAFGVVEVKWHARRRCFVGAARGEVVRPASDDWLFTPELFSEEERPGFGDWLSQRVCRTAALYHDSIPLRFPDITWPQSVARHPDYLRLLSLFERVLANSEASAHELSGFWRWSGRHGPKPRAVTLGADGVGTRRITDPSARQQSRTLLMVGIVEPRKDQAGVLDAAEVLWREGQTFDLVFVGRINPHFGKPIVTRMRDLAGSGRPVSYRGSPHDAAMAGLLAGARCLLLPSFAEGCGLPAMEALWAGLPVVCRDLPALNETAAGGGCRTFAHGRSGALAAAMREILANDALVARLTREACSRPLPTWVDSARAVIGALME